MASLTSTNPRLVKGSDSHMARTLQRAKDTTTWRAGQPGHYSSGLATPVATNGTVVQFMFARDQTTSTSSTDVWVNAIDSSMIFEMNELNGTLSNSNVGETYECDVSTSGTANIFTVDIGATSNACVKIVRIAAGSTTGYEPERNSTGDTQARCYARFPASVVDG